MSAVVKTSKLDSNNVERNGVSKLKVVKTNFIWTIDNFSSLTQQGDYVKSPDFTEVETQSKWSVHTCPVEVLNPNFMGLYLHLKHSWLVLSVKFQFFLLNNNKKIIYKGWTADADFVNGASLGFSNFIERSMLFNRNLNLLFNDSLSILCDIKITTALVDFLNTKHILPVIDSQSSSIANDYYSLWKSGKYSDIKLIINGKSYSAHKSILSARSTFFKDLFEKHEEIGNHLHLLEINDFSTEVMLEVLMFIYCGKVENYKLLSNNLSSAAEKFCIWELKLLCENKLRDENSSTPCIKPKKDMELNGNAIEFTPSSSSCATSISSNMEISNSDLDMITEIYNEVVERNRSVETMASSSNSSFNNSSSSNSLEK